MKVVLTQIAPKSVPKSVVAIGSFDGVHYAHRQLLERVVATSKEQGAASIVVTFSPHPRLFFEGESSSIRFLTTQSEKITLLEELGIDYLICLPFENYFMMKGVEFVENVLVNGLGCVHLFAGYNHNFGSDRISISEIEKIDKFAIKCSFIKKFEVEGFKVSSTVIRLAISQGKVRHGCMLLSAPYLVRVEVLNGRECVVTDDFKLLPPDGFYTGLVGSCNVEVEVRNRTLIIHSGCEYAPNSYGSVDVLMLSEI